MLRDITASRVRRDLHEHSRELLALSAISADIASSLEVDRVIERALQQIATLTQAGMAMVYLQDEHDPAMLHLAGQRLATGHIVLPPEHMPVDFDDENSPTAHGAANPAVLFVTGDDQNSAYRESLKDLACGPGRWCR